MLYRQHLQIDNATVPFYCAVNSASVQLLGLLPDHKTLNGALQRFGKTDMLVAINLTNLGLMEKKNIHLLPIQAIENFKSFVHKHG